MRTAIAVLTAASATLLAGCIHISAVGWSSNEWNRSDKDTQTHAIVVPDAEGIESLDVLSHFGPIDIAPHGTPLPEWADCEIPVHGENDAIIIALVGSKNENRLDAALVLPIVQDGELSIRDKWEGGRNDKHNEGVGYAVRLPAVHETKLWTDFGTINLSEASGHARVFTDFGSIDIDAHAGSLDAYSDYGAVNVAAASGHHAPFKIESDFGSINVTDVHVPVEVISDYGSLNLDRMGGPVKAFTDFGGIHLTLTQNNEGPVDIVSDYGAVSLAVGQAFRGEITAETGHGRVHTHGLSVHGAQEVGDEDFRRITFPRVGPESRARTDFGAVTIRATDGLPR